MPDIPSGPLQTALLARLGAHAPLTALVGTRIWDEPPQGETLPLVRLGAIEPRPVRESGCEGTWLVTFGIEVQSRPAPAGSAKGRTEATAIADAVFGALDEQEAALTMPGWHVSRLFFETMTVNRLDDGRSYEAVVAFSLMAEAI